MTDVPFCTHSAEGFSWIDDGIQDAEDFVEWTGALERAEVVRARLLKDGWTDVT